MATVTTKKCDVFGTMKDVSTCTVCVKMESVIDGDGDGDG